MLALVPSEEINNDWSLTPNKRHHTLPGRLQNKRAKPRGQGGKTGTRPWVLEKDIKQFAEKKQDNDLKHTAKAAKEWLIERDVNILETVSPDLNPVERTQDKSFGKDAKSYLTDN